MNKIIVLFLLLTLPRLCQAWGDRPDRDDHEDTDRIYRAAQEQTNAEYWEEHFRTEEAKKALRKFLRKMDEKKEEAEDEAEE